MSETVERPRLILTYSEEGKVFTCLISWRGETIQVLSNPSNATTRELQRADEIVQALIISEKMRANR